MSPISSQMCVNFWKIIVQVDKIDSKLNASSLNQTYMSKNSSVGLLNLCTSDDECIPIIRICSDSEMPSDLFVKVGGFVMLMLIISLIAAVYLYHMGNYSNMFKLSSIFGVPIMHPTLLQDIVGAGFRGKDTKLWKRFVWQTKI